MYTLTYFSETRTEVLHDLIAQHPLGTLVTHGAQGLSADHLPFEIAPAADGAPCGVLRAHVARANPVWRQGGDALIVFQGAAGYISPSLYEDKPLTGKVVPTWNYAVVHAHGPLRAIEDPAWILALLERLTAQHEAPRSMPWSVGEAPPAFIDKLLAAIVGIEIPVQRLEGKWKMSQNRSANDRRTIADATGLAMPVQ
ncbi:FMN-binding negative transcriptional regulator [Massilia sp. H-1]|nr:FMN-binding negative transcriptional regulator [Massilia sp. H-1]